MKYSRAHKFYYFETDAIFAGKTVKQFFYRSGRKGEWKALLSTDTSLTPYKAYQILNALVYRSFLPRMQIPSQARQMPMQGLRFAGSFNSTLNILQDNLLSYVKRFESYETIGGLFREITAQTVELSVTEKILGLIQQLVSAIADFFSADFNEILANIIYENKQLKAIMRVA